MQLVNFYEFLWIFIINYLNIRILLILFKPFNLLLFVGLWDFLNYILNFSNKTWKKYLKEKHRTTKEKLARERTWARKHETKVGTYKGFYIPTILPRTEQAKFFFKKRDEDEWKRRDEELAQEVLKFRQSSFDWLDFKLYKKINNYETKKTNSISYLKTTFTHKINYNSVFKNSKFINKFNFSFWSNLNKFFFFKFSKLFFKIPKLPLYAEDNFHIWSYLNIGNDSKEFFNFFFSHYFPFYFLKFNFLKIKILILKRFKELFNGSYYTVNKIFSNYNSFFFIKKLLDNFLYKKKGIFLNFIFFTNTFLNFQNFFYFKLNLKSFLINFISQQTSLFYRIFLGIFKLLKRFLNFSDDKKSNLFTIFFSRLSGFTDLSFTKSFLKKKIFYTLNSKFYLDLNKNTYDLKNFINFFFFFLPNINKNYFNLTYYFLLIDFFFKNFNLYLKTKVFFSKPIVLTFFENFSKIGILSSKNSFPDSHTLSTTFFSFLKTWIKYFENIWYLLYTSFPQQIKIIEEINVANTLFKFILRKGKKLTARSVFLWFLKKFKKKYALPALPIFVHALLFIEPKVWLKKKKIAGKLYEIPIFISPSRSKRIAIRWLLEAANKRKTASVSDSLAQEVWDACLKWGLSFNNWEVTHMTIKWNKAYLRWL